jgi:hypothetical protein
MRSSDHDEDRNVSCVQGKFYTGDAHLVFAKLTPWPAHGLFLFEAARFIPEHLPALAPSLSPTFSAGFRPLLAWHAHCSDNN